MAEKKIIVGKTDALTIIDGQNDFIKVDGALYVAGVDGEISSGCIMSDIKAPLTLFPFGHKARCQVPIVLANRRLLMLVRGLKHTLSATLPKACRHRTATPKK